MRILFVWPGLTGYMGDCWRELASRGDVELRVVINVSERHFGAGFFADDVMHELDWSVKLPDGWVPDIVFSVGWRDRICRAAALRYWGQGVKKVCCFDMPWEWRIRKIAAKFVLWPFLRHFDAAFVNGKSALAYAKWLGFRKIFTGLISTNLHRFGEHVGGGGFLYVGRECYDKGVDVLRQAHELYRSRGGRWGLKMVNGLSPDVLGSVYAKADAFVLASRWEPWGVVLVEAAGAGLPIICTERCGARHEVVRDGVNGRIVKAGSVRALADAMAEVEKGGFDGDEGRALAEKFGCGPWAGRVLEICKELLCLED